MFVRPFVYQSGGNRQSRAGDGYLANPRKSTIAADANSVLTSDAILGGVILRAGATVARTDTTDTAVAILAAMPEMDVGDTFVFRISVQVAFAITIAGGVGVNATGNLVIAANTSKELLLTKTSATTMDLVGL